MEYDKIKDLIYTIEGSNIAEFEMQLEGDIYIRMNKGIGQSEVIKSEKKQTAVREETKSENAVKKTVETVKSEPISEPITIIPDDEVEVKEGNIIVSPMVGTFYQSSSPDDPPFKKVGDKVKKGEVVCIIEAMKIMNEITSKFDGEIAEILVENEEMVEFD
ncbi:MAG: acetyl-CoA carboxylase biotin carboxyl carrier protein, partial [Firmicutes bacterium]|nr:acetyl-CoA carboxylase biotin carboxyl carrier protein [Bacillota bacterium]